MEYFIRWKKKNTPPLHTGCFMLYSHGTLQDLYTTKEATQHEIDEKNSQWMVQVSLMAAVVVVLPTLPGHDPAAGY